MEETYWYPFAAVAGQDAVKRAVLIALVNPKAGGVLISGKKGTAKSTLVYGLGKIAGQQKRIDLPLNVTEDMLFGSIDLEAAVLEGNRQFAPGILTRADKNILYIDEVNLLQRDLLGAVLESNARGINIVEREGISCRQPLNSTIIATMNPEEGSLPPQILDKFGLYAETTAADDVSLRVEIMKRVLAFEQNRRLFRQQYGAETDEIAARVLRGRQLLPQVEISNAIITLAAEMAARGFCAGHRAEIYLLETAKTIAALEDRSFVLPRDMEDAAQFVLPHRMRKPPEDAADNDETKEPENNGESNDPENEQPPEPQEDADNFEMPDNNGADSEQPEADDADGPVNNKEQPHDRLAPEEQTVPADRNFILPPILLERGTDQRFRRGSGKRSLTRTDAKQGRYVRSKPPKEKVRDLAFDATLRAAAPYQRIRVKNGFAVRIEPRDFREKVREKRIGATFLFVVDASASMGARERMRAVKGAIFSMLQEAYQKRDKVGLIVFRRDRAETLLPVTRSVDLAQKLLGQMPTGGRTPLREGLEAALINLSVLSRQDKTQESVLILITDGRANNTAGSPKDTVQGALESAAKIGKTAITSVVIDTEADFVKLGIAKNIAQKMNATYYRLHQLSKEQVLRIVKNTGNLQ